MSQIIHPDYYKGNSIEAWDYIKDHDLNFDLGNAIKYITRAGKKDGESKRNDLEKAMNYICHELRQEGLVCVYNVGNASDEDVEPDEVTIWSATSDGNCVAGELRSSDIELCRSKSTGEYTLYVERAYDFGSSEKEADYLGRLKELLANYVLLVGEESSYTVTYSDDINPDYIYGDTVVEIYEKFAFFVDAYVRYVYGEQ